MRQFQKTMQHQFDVMCSTGRLFESTIPGSKVWELYLSSFEADPIFRDPASTEHNCNQCNNFVRRYGNIVAIDTDGKLLTLFDGGGEGEYAPVAAKLKEVLSAAPIKEVFVETFHMLNSLPYEVCKKTNARFKLGLEKNSKRYTKDEAEKYGVVKADEIREFRHMFLYVPAAFVDTSGKSAEAIQAGYRDAKNVFQRAMETISLDTLMLVKDLILQDSLLDGRTHLFKVEAMIPLKQEYDTLASAVRDVWCWSKSYGFNLAKFRNELIGVLCTELSEGKELNDACKAWNIRVDPVNYMRAASPITKTQIENAKRFVEENGYTTAFSRRHVLLQDIKASEILHVNSGDGKIRNVSIFDNVKPAVSTQHKLAEFDGVEEVHIDKFMSDILPNCTAVEALFLSSQQGNLVTLTTSNDENSKPLFKWNNNYSWTFNGNLSGKSMIKEAVKAAGGNTTGVLNFRLAWNESGTDNSDLDLWAIEPGNIKIGFNTGFRKNHYERSPCSGQLDVDIISPNRKLAVENITWIDSMRMKNGVYHVYVNPYYQNNSQGFKLEIEFAGETYLYSYDTPVSYNVQVANVTLKDGVFSIEHLIPVTGATNVTKEIYNIETNRFHKVNLICTSPNHWGENKVGNKYYFFMLDGCKAPESIKSFHSDNLLPELAEHRKVLEVLSTTTMIAPDEKQLSGLGFNATVREELILKLSGTHKRVIKLKF